MRFYGAIGFADEIAEVSPGVWKEIMAEFNYFGDVVRDFRRLEAPTVIPTGTQNDDISLGNSFSILADPYAVENMNRMRYVNWQGSNWTVTGVEVRRPRLILTIGGLWNGDTPGAPGPP
jgi:hypothetical protein